MSTPVVKALKLGAKTVRKVAGHNNALERFVRDRYLKSIRAKTNKEFGPGYVQHSGGNFVVLKSTKDPDTSRVGIVLRGGCDLPSIFVYTPQNTSSLAKLNVRLPVNIKPSEPRSLYNLEDDIVLRNSTRT